MKHAILSVALALFGLPALAASPLEPTELSLACRPDRTIRITCGTRTASQPAFFGYVDGAFELSSAQSANESGAPSDVTLTETLSAAAGLVTIATPNSGPLSTVGTAGSYREAKMLSEGSGFHLLALTVDGVTLEIEGNTAGVGPSATIRWNGQQWSQPCLVSE